MGNISTLPQTQKRKITHFCRYCGHIVRVCYIHITGDSSQVWKQETGKHEPPFSADKVTKFTYLTGKIAHFNSFMPYFVTKFKKRIKKNKKALYQLSGREKIAPYQQRHMSRITNKEPKK